MRGVVLGEPPLFAFVAEATEALGAERLAIEEALRDGGPEAAVRAWLAAQGTEATERAVSAHQAFFADYAGLASWAVTRGELRALDAPAAVVTGPGERAAHVSAAADALAGLLPDVRRSRDGDLVTPTLEMAGMRRAVVLLAVVLAGVRQRGGAAPLTTDSRTAPRAPDRAGKIVRVAAVGDSITAGYPRWDPIARVPPAAPGEARVPAASTPTGPVVSLGKRFRFRNCGVSGARTDEIAQQLDECAGRADVLIVQGGFNDLFEGLRRGDRPQPPRMVRRRQVAGMRVLIAELLPVAGDEYARSAGASSPSTRQSTPSPRRSAPRSCAGTGSSRTRAPAARMDPDYTNDGRTRRSRAIAGSARPSSCPDAFRATMAMVPPLRAAPAASSASAANGASGSARTVTSRSGDRAGALRLSRW